MNFIPPSFEFYGDKNKAKLAKAQALQLYNLVSRQVQREGLPFATRTYNLSDGSSIVFDTKKLANTPNVAGKIRIFSPPSPVAKSKKVNKIYVNKIDRNIPNSRNIYIDSFSPTTKEAFHSGSNGSSYMDKSYWYEKESEEHPTVCISWSNTNVFIAGKYNTVTNAFFPVTACCYAREKKVFLEADYSTFDNMFYIYSFKVTKVNEEDFEVEYTDDYYHSDFGRVVGFLQDTNIAIVLDVNIVGTQKLYKLDLTTLTKTLIFEGSLTKVSYTNTTVAGLRNYEHTGWIDLQYSESDLITSSFVPKEAIYRIWIHNNTVNLCTIKTIGSNYEHHYKETLDDTNFQYSTISNSSGNLSFEYSVYSCPNFSLELIKKYTASSDCQNTFSYLEHWPVESSGNTSQNATSSYQRPLYYNSDIDLEIYEESFVTQSSSSEFLGEETPSGFFVKETNIQASGNFSKILFLRHSGGLYALGELSGSSDNRDFGIKIFPNHTIPISPFTTVSNHRTSQTGSDDFGNYTEAYDTRIYRSDKTYGRDLLDAYYYANPYITQHNLNDVRGFRGHSHSYDERFLLFTYTLVGILNSEEKDISVVYNTSSKQIELFNERFDSSTAPSLFPKGLSTTQLDFILTNDNI